MMLEGLQILIDRMETNPDEFVDGEWDYFLEDNPVLSDLFTEEEKEAFKEARVRLSEFRKERHRRRFTEQVIQHLFNRNNPEEDEYDPDPFGSTPVKREGSTITYDTKNRYKWASTKGVFGK